MEGKGAAQITNASDPLAQLEQLGSLRDAGILTDEEFAEKKAALLAQIG